MITSEQIYKIITLITEANKVALKYYQSNEYKVLLKEDRSPVTDADNIISEMLSLGLQNIVPGVPVISEENKMEVNVKIIEENKRFWLVDPIDGTQGFISKDGNFTINAGLISDNEPIFGIISEPLLDEIYFTEDGKAYCIKKGNLEAISVNKMDKGLRILTSRRHSSKKTADVISALPATEVMAVSSSYKFCMIAAGRADCYLHFGPTCTWDTAAGHAIVNAAGGSVKAIGGHEIIYNNKEFINPAFCGFNHIAYKVINNTILKEVNHE